MNQIETRIAKLVKVVRAEGAYCCRLNGVMDLAEKPTTVRITMRCVYHGSYTFEVEYTDFSTKTQEQEDLNLMRQISSGISQNIRKSDNRQRK